MDYVGVTEISDAGYHYPKIKQLYKANILITKHLEEPGFHEFLLNNNDKCILHATITGWGGTKIEPGVPTPEESFAYLRSLIDKGFPVNHIVLRIDPIIPTPEGIERMLDTFSDYLDQFGSLFLGSASPRIRISILDLYEHVKLRLIAAGIILPYTSFNAPEHLVIKVLSALEQSYKSYLNIMHQNAPIIESCAENFSRSWINPCGCVSQNDINILGVDVKLEGHSHQRKSCRCPANKKQLIYRKMERCKSGCMYCYLGRPYKS